MNRDSKLLFVEDNPMQQKLLQFLAAHLGYSITVVGTCGQAAELISKPNSFELIFLDNHLPDGTGLEFVNELRSIQDMSGCRVPIVSMTADDLAKDVCIEAGMDDHLLKPFSIDAIRAMVDRWAPFLKMNHCNFPFSK